MREGGDRSRLLSRSHTKSDTAHSTVLMGNFPQGEEGPCVVVVVTGNTLRNGALIQRTTQNWVGRGKGNRGSRYLGSTLLRRRSKSFTQTSFAWECRKSWTSRSSISRRGWLSAAPCEKAECLFSHDRTTAPTTGSHPESQGATMSANVLDSTYMP